MKIAIQKLATGNVKVTLQTDPGKKPLAVELTPARLQMLVGLLNQAGAATAFEFSLSM